jgi:hypothetical protein
VESELGRERLEQGLLDANLRDDLMGVVAYVQELDDLRRRAVAREIRGGVLQVAEVLRGGFLRGTGGEETEAEERVSLLREGGAIASREGKAGGDGRRGRDGRGLARRAR